MKKLPLLIFLVFFLGCAPPLEDECYSAQMDKWDSAVISEKGGEKFRYISEENSDGVLDEKQYPDTSEGKTLFDSHSWSKCTQN
jgi:hypothetical protein